MQSAFIAGLWGNSNLDGEGTEGLRAKILSEMMENTETEFEQQVERLYGFDRDAEIERMMEKDPFFAAIVDPVTGRDGDQS